jgi:hypothetical protein
MTIQAALSLSNEKLTLQLADNQGQITIFYSNDKKLVAPESSVYLLFKEQKLRAIGTTEGPFSSRTAYDTCVQITPPWEMEQGYLIQRLVETAEESKLKVTSKGAKKNSSKSLSNCYRLSRSCVNFIRKVWTCFS